MTHQARARIAAAEILIGRSPEQGPTRAGCWLTSFGWRDNVIHVHILVTGGAGYIGCILTETLLDQGAQVTVLDRFFFGQTLTSLADRSGLRLIKDDIRWCPPSVFDGIDAVLDLAAISNDPAGELDPEKTMDINFRGRARVASMAKERGVRKYVLASSCSIYGFQEGLITEESPPNPLTTYAAANLEVERANLPLGDDRFCVTVLRQATVYGLSPRMRFDLAINGMTLGLQQKGMIGVLRDGMQWRPFVHVRDTCRAFLAVLAAGPELVNRQIFNVGDDDQNVQILPLAQRVCGAVGRPFSYAWYGDPDHRSYRVGFRKIQDMLGYKTKYTPEDGVREIFQALEDKRVEAGPKTSTVAWYKSLIEWHGIVRDVALGDVLL